MSDAVFKSDFGERLKKAAKDAGKTQDTLSVELKEQYEITLGKHSISNHYAGQALPDLLTLKAYCELLDVKADYLLFGGDDMKANRPAPADDLAQKIKDRDAKTALLSLTTLLLLTQFEVTKSDSEELSLTMYEKNPYDTDFSFETWSKYAKKLQSVAAIDPDVLNKAEKFQLMRNRIEDAFHNEVAPQMSSDRMLQPLYMAGVPDPDDELPF